MQRYCISCGTELASSSNFCPLCGIKYVPEARIREKDKKKILTTAIIEKEIKQQVTLLDLGGQVIAIISIVVLAILVNPLVLLLTPLIIITAIQIVAKMVRHKRCKYYIMLNSCKSKERVNDEGAGIKWRLWFLNKDKKLFVGVDVEEEVYHSTQIEDKFYLITFLKMDVPTLAYREMEWIYEKQNK